LPDGLHELRRGLVPDGAVRSFLIVLSPISRAFRTRIVQRQEPVLVDALGPNLSIERFHEGIVGRLAGSREVQRHAVAPDPQIEIARDELRTVIDTNAFGHSVDCGHPLQRVDNVRAFLTLAHIDRRR